MRQSIKIFIIVFTALAIVGLLYYFTKKIDEAQVEMIEPQNFVEYVKRQANKEIKNKPFDVAKSAFYKLIGEINTEDFVWLNDSTKALTEDKVLKCKRIAFYAYAPIFTAHGIEYFTHPSWSIAYADGLRDEANALLDYDIAENNTQVKADLNQIVKNTKGYHEALAVVKSASNCSTVDAVKTVISNAKKYKYDPLTNNRQLMSDLNDVPMVAKESLSNRIVSRVNGLISHNCSYAEYAKWYEDYQRMIGVIEEYERAFGTVSELSNSKTLLEEADDAALECYD